MPALTSLALLKSQLNLDTDTDDDLLGHKLEAAEAWITAHTGKAFVSEPSLTEAALQLASYWYEQREAASDLSIRAVPFGVYALLQAHRESVVG